MIDTIKSFFTKLNFDILQDSSLMLFDSFSQTSQLSLNVEAAFLLCTVYIPYSSSIYQVCLESLNSPFH